MRLTCPTPLGEWTAAARWQLGCGYDPRLAESIASFGVDEPITVANGRVIDGEKRVLYALLSGHSAIPVDFQ